MICDLRDRDTDTTITTDIAVIGGGAAAIAFATRLKGSGRKITILEAGGLHRDSEAQAFYAGTQSGIPYFPLDESRYRLLGGSTFRWGARSAPFRPVDFGPRPWLDLAGWPIDGQELQAGYDAVPAFLDLYTPFAFAPPDWAAFGAEPPRFDPDQLEATAFQFGKNLLLGEHFRKELKDTPDVDVVLNAIVHSLKANENGRAIGHLDVRTTKGTACRVTANTYILACGGIENARLLLLSDDVMPAGLCNADDQVGRYFMEHPTVSAGSIDVADPHSLHDVFSPGMVGGRLVETCIAPTPAAMKDLGILNVNASTRLKVGSDATQALREIVWNARHRRMPLDLDWYQKNRWLMQRLGAIARDPLSIVTNLIRHKMGKPKRFRIEDMYLELRTEQMPNPESRVTLGEKRDVLGQRLPHLHWELTATDKRTMREMAALVDRELRRLGLGQVNIADWLRTDDLSFDPEMVGGHHHMGTTRMSADPKSGVVDENCRTHAMENLYIAGSSVFPTASYVNPTMTLLALTFRLADHLRTTP